MFGKSKPNMSADATRFTVETGNCVVGNVGGMLGLVLGVIPPILEGIWK